MLPDPPPSSPAPELSEDELDRIVPIAMQDHPAR